MNSSINTHKFTIQIRVLPNAKHEGWAGLWNGTHYKIALKAPAVDGKANTALINFLADYTDLPKNAFTILQGTTSRCKVIQIQGLTELKPPIDPGK